MDVFKLDENNILLKEQYEKGDNYFIRNNSIGDKCYIFCSSNGIYYPNTQSEYEKTIMEEDRYEWWGVSNSDEIQASAKKIIYVRDIYKQYYVRGINSSIDSIDELCKFLKIQTSNLKIVTCGISSGGYLATILGIYLQAECVFNFGGQWSLYEELRLAEKNNKLECSQYFLNKNRYNEKCNRYYNITFLLENNKIPIMYFYSALEDGDIKQVEILQESEMSNVYCFAMKSSAHGYTLFNSCYRKVLTCPLRDLTSIYSRCKNKIVSLRKMCFYLLDIHEAVKECVKDVLECHKSLQIIIRGIGRWK